MKTQVCIYRSVCVCVSVTNTETPKASPIETFTKYIILSLYSNFIVRKQASSQASRAIVDPRAPVQFERGAKTLEYTCSHTPGRTTRSCRRTNPKIILVRSRVCSADSPLDRSEQQARFHTLRLRLSSHSTYLIFLVSDRKGMTPSGM
uniref:Uncharacterized protein n=1 Tax=Caenorhabditis japonica TaxID=281687 RepID=A0A8R1IDX0_CAEJA